MTWFNALQLLLAASAVYLTVRRAKMLCFDAPLDGDAFCEALETALAAEQVGLARRIAASNEPAWPAQLARLGLDEGGGPEGAARLDEQLTRYEETAWNGLRALVSLGRMASPLAFIGVVIEIGRAYGGGSGIEGLQRGGAVSAALERSIFTFALGMSTLTLCMASLGVLRGRARAVTRDLRRVARIVSREEPAARSEM